MRFSHSYAPYGGQVVRQARVDDLSRCASVRYRFDRSVRRRHQVACAHYSQSLSNRLFSVISLVSSLLFFLLVSNSTHVLTTNDTNDLRPRYLPSYHHHYHLLHYLFAIPPATYHHTPSCVTSDLDTSLVEFVVVVPMYSPPD